MVGGTIDLVPRASWPHVPSPPTESQDSAGCSWEHGLSPSADDVENDSDEGCANVLGGVSCRAL
jgi:hypothetical protein